MTTRRHRTAILVTLAFAVGANLTGPSGEAWAAPPESIITTFVGGGTGGPGAWQMATHPDGTVAFIGATLSGTPLMRMTPDGTVTTQGLSTSCSQDQVVFQCAYADVAIAPDGSIYVLTWAGRVIKKTPNVGTGTVIITYADWGIPVATDCGFFESLAFAPDGTLYVMAPCAIYTLTDNGAVTHVAGTGTKPSAPTEGDGGPAADAPMIGSDLAIEADGSIVVGVYTTVRRIDATSGVISTIAGNGVSGFSGDGGPALSAAMSGVATVALDAQGNLYVSSFNQYRVRMVDTAGIITTVAGTGEIGYSGDGGPALEARLSSNLNVAVDPLTGDLLIGEVCGCSGSSYAAGIRRVTRRSALVGTVTGGSAAASGVVVSVVADWPSWRVVRTTVTDGSGGYRVDDLPAGTYRVRFFDPQGRFAREWWDDASTYAAGDAITLEVASEVVADAELDAARGSLQGFVGDGSGVVAGAWVQVFGPDGYVAGAVTGANGGYWVNGLRPGDYWVRVSGPTPGQHVSTWYPHAVLFPNAQTVTVTAEGATTVNGALLPRS